MIAGVYPILDLGDAWTDRDVDRFLDDVLGAGVRTLQLRAKAIGARRFHDVAARCRRATQASGAYFVVDDRPDIAVSVGADAVHLGQQDLDGRLVRPWLPRSMHIGVSCHSRAEVTAAIGVADSIGYGPVFATASKEAPDPVVGVDGLARIVLAFPDLPVAAIGGIDLERLPSIRRSGARAAAMIGAFAASEGRRFTAERAVAIWEDRG